MAETSFLLREVRRVVPGTETVLPGKVDGIGTQR
jgi:hypothetical protein